MNGLNRALWHTKATTTEREITKKVDKLTRRIAFEEKERNTLEERLNSTKSLDDLRGQESEFERQNEDDKAVMNEENALSSGKEATEARVAERKLELSQLRTVIEEREKACRFSKK